MKITDPNRTCPECGAAFVAHNGAQRFCTSAHQRAFHDVMKVRGKVMMPLVLTWRGGRHITKGNARGRAHTQFAFLEMCRLADFWSEADKAAGRSPALAVAAKADSSWAATDIPSARRR